MACGATLKRHREFDPLQNSPDRSPKRICLPIDFMSPSSSSSHNRVLNGSAVVEAAQKLIHDKLAARISPAREKQMLGSSSAVLRSNNYASCSVASQAWSVSQSPVARQSWPVAQSVQSPATSAVAWPGCSSGPSVSRVPLRKEQLFTMQQVEMMCQNILKEHEDRVREEYDNILTNKLSEQYEGLVNFNLSQIHNKFDKSDASYVS